MKRTLHVWLDALYLKVRQSQRIVSQAVVVAIGARESGEREVIGFALGGGGKPSFLAGVSVPAGGARLARRALADK